MFHIVESALEGARINLTRRFSAALLRRHATGWGRSVRTGARLRDTDHLRRLRLYPYGRPNGVKAKDCRNE
jgi:hypothetical protein